MSGKCGLTVTGIRTRYECFLRQLKSYGLVLYTIMHGVLYTSVVPDLRSHLRICIRDPNTYTTFRAALLVKCPGIHTATRLALVSYIALMGLECRAVAESLDYTEALWRFYTRLVYERPCLIQPDTYEGSHVTYLQESLQWFIAEQVHLKKADDTM
jgi:hypothetical protein